MSCMSDEILECLSIVVNAFESGIERRDEDTNLIILRTSSAERTKMIDDIFVVNLLDNTMELG